MSLPMTRFSPLRFVRAVLCAAVAVLSAAAALAQPADVGATHSFRSQPIPGRYIVVFKSGVADPAAESDRTLRAAGGLRHHVYSRAIKGFAATLPDAAVQALRNDPAVDFIEQDQTISISGVESPATWGLDRIDQADRPLDTLYHYEYTGAGVRAFIIDTGIRASHSEFTGRVLAGFTAISDGNGTNDCNGHGTHVSGTVGGTTWGVAKGVTLVPVRVLDCNGSGTNSGVIAGIDWVTNHAVLPAVANMSLGGGLSSALNAAVANAVAHGVVMVVAAGNDSQFGNVSACTKSPASEPSAITVGATTSADARAVYSNVGTCVDIFAPGSGITSAWNTSNSATNTISGTSMATPHVTGAAALALETNPGASPAAVTSFLLAHATPNRLSSIGTGSPNLLLYSLGSGTPVEPPPQVIAIRSLTGKVVKLTRGWRAQVVVAVRDVNTSAAIANATVTGSFAPGGSGSCVTGTKGTCTVTSSIISYVSRSTVFTVGNVSGTGKVYDSSQNSAAQLTIIER